jgi:hypothetical protein
VSFSVAATGEDGGTPRARPFVVDLPPRQIKTRNAGRKRWYTVPYDSLAQLQAPVTQTGSFVSAGVPTNGPLPRTGLWIAVDVTAIYGAATFAVNYAVDGVEFNAVGELQVQGGWISAPGLYYVFLGGLFASSIPNPGGIYNPSLQLAMTLAAAGTGSSSSQSTGSSSSSASGGALTITYSAYVSLSAP